MRLEEIKSLIFIVPKSNIPIYRQIIYSIENAIDAKILKEGDLIPSINEISNAYGLAKGTVVTAYQELKERGIISSQPGKGFFVLSIAKPTDLNIFLLFDQMSPYKQILYQSLKHALGTNCHTDIYFYYHNEAIFHKQINENIGLYNYYVIMPHLHTDVSDIVLKLPREKTLILNQEITGLKETYTHLVQNFEKDIFEGLTKARQSLQKYSEIILVSASDVFQFVPMGIINGLKKYCTEQKIKYQIVNTLLDVQIKGQQAFLIFNDNDMVSLIKTSKDRNLQIGKDIGIIAYDETPVKQILEGGITVISTDFEALGKQAASLILTKGKGYQENPSQFILRKSL